MDVWSFLHRFKTDWRLLIPLLGLSAIGMGYGWYFYWQVGQFDPSSSRFVAYGWWPLVSDSPNAVAFWVAAVLLYKLRAWRHWALDAAAFTLNAYVGFWTTTLFLIYPERMRTFDWASVADGNSNPVLFVSHLGMPVLALILAKDMRTDKVPWWGMGVVVAALAAYVYVDYWGPHIHPAPFLHPDDALLHHWAPWLMVVAVVGWLAIVVPARLRANRA